jgi:CPA2 family monovalent cation:H+ antiporter-2
MVTLFFASVGMLAKPLWFLSHLHWIILVAVLIFIFKATIIYGVGRLFGLNNHQAIATGITLGQIGEFSFVIAATARDGGVLGSNAMDLIVSVIIVLMLVTPYMVALAIPFANRVIAILSRRSSSAESHRQPADLEPTNRVLVVGLGPTGRQVVHTLIEHKLEPIAIDVNPQSQNLIQQIGIKVHLGDASHEDILMHAGLSGVCMAVVTVPDPGTSIRVVQMIRLLSPQVTVVARCRYNRYLADLEKAGADIVIDEEATMGQMLSQKIMDYIKESSGSGMACRLAGQMPEVSA